MTKIYHDDIGEVALIDHVGSDQRVVDAARVSFAADGGEWRGEKDEKLIRYMLRNGHTSPFEHCVVTWRFTVPLFIRSQHHRHRTWAFNEVSRRYTSERLEFYLPETFRTQHVSNKQASNEDEINPSWSADYPLTASDAVKRHCAQSLHVYNGMIGRGVCREQARMVLPQNLYTSYFGTVSLHNAFGFLRQRLDSHAQWEIRKVAEAMYADLERLYPISVREYKELAIHKV